MCDICRITFERQNIPHTWFHVFFACNFTHLITISEKSATNRWIPSRNCINMYIMWNHKPSLCININGLPFDMFYENCNGLIYQLYVNLYKESWFSNELAKQRKYSRHSTLKFCIKSILFQTVPIATFLHLELILSPCPQKVFNFLYSPCIYLCNFSNLFKFFTIKIKMSLLSYLSSFSERDSIIPRRRFTSFRLEL